MRYPTESSPKILFDSTAHILEIRGSSYMEHTLEFYEPLMSWIETYLSSLKRSDRVQVDIELVYFNSTSSRVLLEFFDALNEKAFQAEVCIDVNWFYESEDDDMREFGEEFQHDFKALVFHFSEIRRNMSSLR